MELRSIAFIFMFLGILIVVYLRILIDYKQKQLNCLILTTIPLSFIPSYLRLDGSNNYKPRHDAVCLFPLTKEKLTKINQ